MSDQRKWTVLGAEAMNGWLVVRPGDILRMDDGRLECWEVHSRHHTWEEAMQEADRMARTVTVTLPAQPRVEVIAKSGKYVRLIMSGTRDALIIKDDPAVQEVFSLALLAHARKDRN